MNRKLAISGALAGVALLATACFPGSAPRPAEPSLTVQAANSIPAPSDIVGAVVDGRASFTWSKPANARDVVIYDVTKGQPGRVVGASSGTSWTSARLPGTSPFSFQLVARDLAKVEQTRSAVITLYPAGAPAEPTPTTPAPTPTTPPPAEPTTEPTTPSEPTTPPTEEPTEPPTPTAEPTTPPPVEPDPEPEQPAAQPTRVWDVNAGDSVFDVWPEIHAPSHDRVTVSTEQVFPGEDASIKFVTNRADVMGNPGANSTWNPGNTGTRRAEVRDSIAASGNITEGTEQWWSWANYFPADFNWGERNQFFGVMQFHQTANSGNPPVHFWVDDQENLLLDVRGGTGGRTSGDAQHTGRFNLGPVALGAWNDIQLHVVWSSNPNVGLVEVYRGGERVLSENAANLYSGQSAYVKQGIYSANGTADEPIQTIYTSTTRLGDSLESVRPPSVGD